MIVWQNFNEPIYSFFVKNRVFKNSSQKIYFMYKVKIFTESSFDLVLSIFSDFFMFFALLKESLC